MKKVKAIIERGRDGLYSIYMGCDDLDYGIHGLGDSEAEARADFMLAYKEMREHYQETGKHFEEVEFEFKTDVVSFLQYYATVFSLVGLSKITGINKSQISHYINGTSRPSKTTELKITQAMQNFGKEMTAAMAI